MLRTRRCHTARDAEPRLGIATFFIDEPAEGACPEPAEGACPEPAEGACPEPAEGACPEPAEGACPEPAEGACPEPAEGACPEPAEGACPEPAEGACPEPAEGACPEPAEGAAVSHTFPGFRSRCTIPLSWANSRPLQVSMAMAMACSSATHLSVPLAIRSSTLPPAITGRTTRV